MIKRLQPWQELTAGLVTASVAVAAIVVSVFVSRSSDPPPPPPLTVSLDQPELIKDGPSTTLRIRGLVAREAVRITLADNPIGPDLSADGEGKVTTPLSPRNAALGRYEIRVRGVQSGRQGSTVVVVKEPETRLVARSTGPWSGRLGAIRLTVEQVRRYSNWLVVLDVRVDNGGSSEITLSRFDFRAVDDSGRTYGMFVDNPANDWAGSVPAGRWIRGSIALDHSVDPKMRRLTVSFVNLPTPDGFRDLTADDIRLPVQQ